VLQKERKSMFVTKIWRHVIWCIGVVCSCVFMAAVYGSQSSLPNYYNDAPDRPLFGESRPRV